MRRHVTLLFLRREGEILLAMKKRGLGTGKWNGVGGKLEPGETAEQAAIRECEEEIGVTPHKLRKVAEIDFYLTDSPDFNHYAHVYETEIWDGDPIETDEMRPGWFALGDIPYGQMWGDDKFWLPVTLAGKKLKGKLVLDDDENIVENTLTEVTSEEKWTHGSTT